MYLHFGVIFFSMYFAILYQWRRWIQLKDTFHFDLNHIWPTIHNARFQINGILDEKWPSDVFLVAYFRIHGSVICMSHFLLKVMNWSFTAFDRKMIFDTLHWQWRPEYGRSGFGCYLVPTRVKLKFSSCEYFKIYSVNSSIPICLIHELVLYGSVSLDN